MKIINDFELQHSQKDDGFKLFVQYGLLLAYPALVASVRINKCY